jgi:hypothetical protein
MVILLPSMWLHSVTAAGGALRVCRSYQVTTSGPSTNALCRSSIRPPITGSRLRRLRCEHRLLCERGWRLHSATRVGGADAVPGIGSGRPGLGRLVPVGGASAGRGRDGAGGRGGIRRQRCRSGADGAARARRHAALVGPRGPNWLALYCAPISSAPKPPESFVRSPSRTRQSGGQSSSCIASPSCVDCRRASGECGHVQDPLQHTLSATGG